VPVQTQLLSPVSPSTQPSPCSPSSSISSPAATIQITPQYAAVTPSSRSHIVPIKGFVHEVLARPAASSRRHYAISRLSGQRSRSFFERRAWVKASMKRWHWIVGLYLNPLSSHHHGNIVIHDTALPLHPAFFPLPRRTKISVQDIFMHFRNNF